MDEKLIRVLKKALRKTTTSRIDKLFDLASSEQSSISEIKYASNKILELQLTVSIPVLSHHWYRARPISFPHTEIDTLDKLLEPPADKCRPGRCNLEGKPCLYLTNNPQALVKEAQVGVSEDFIMLQFDKIPDEKMGLPLIFLGVSRKHLANPHKLDTSYEELIVNSLDKQYEKHLYIETKLHEAFVAESNDTLTYRFTSILVDNLMETPGIAGIYYPSIATSGTAKNLALLPGQIFNKFNAKKAFYYKSVGTSEWELSDSAVIDDNNIVRWGYKVDPDLPKPIGVKKINPSDPDIFIAPWK
ncbi:hypothetical protein [Neptuniibacter sp. QD57_21]|uniref:hypothetical protein n=1 Tax=Neptuniibacter sp. QD57_21 TaxID=3398213 RepID=UPI0039F5E6F9